MSTLPFKFRNIYISTSQGDISPRIPYLQCQNQKNIITYQPHFLQGVYPMILSEFYYHFLSYMSGKMLLGKQDSPFSDISYPLDVSQGVVLADTKANLLTFSLKSPQISSAVSSYSQFSQKLTKIEQKQSKNIIFHFLKVNLAIFDILILIKSPLQTTNIITIKIKIVLPKNSQKQLITVSYHLKNAVTQILCHNNVLIDQDISLILEAIKMQSKRDWATFNIRKVQRKGQVKQPQEFGLFTPEQQFDKYTQIQNYTNPKRQKQLIIDYSVNQAILNSKAYCDLKQNFNQSKFRNAQKKEQLLQDIQKLKKEKEEAEEEKNKLEAQTKKYQELLNGLKQKILETRNKNRQIRDMVQLRMNSQAEYISNMLISMRFQAEYDHDIDPDAMTYEELLQLQQKIGCVSKGLPLEKLQKLPLKQLEEDLEDQCTVCFCGMEKGEIIVILPCGHQFHQGCLKGWLTKQKICPLCKRQIEIK